MALNEDNNFEGFDFDESSGSGGFDDFSFDSDGGFGGESSDSFGNGFGNTDTFDDSFGSDNFSEFNQADSTESPNNQLNTQTSNELDFSGQFDDTSNQPQEENDSAKLKKTAIIAIILGIVVVIIVLIVAGIIGKKVKQSNASNSSTVTVVEKPKNDINVDNIMQSGNKPQTNTTVPNTNTTNTNNKTDEWTEITSSETIDFYDEYQEHIFTITDIKHYAKLTDNTLVVKTELTGSLSGMSGTYKIEVPYNKGSLLNIGNEFSVKVLKGSFNGKNVVGDIKY